MAASAPAAYARSGSSGWRSAAASEGSSEPLSAASSASAPWGADASDQMACARAAAARWVEGQARRQHVQLQLQLWQ
jgi:hypothetical protein